MKRPLLRSLVVLPLVLACADLGRAREAYESGDVDTAREHWEELARRGFPRAQYELGRLDARSETDSSAAIEESEASLRYAYAEGVRGAAFELGRLYERPDFVRHSFTEAARWYAVAEAESNAPSLRLARLRLEGLGVPRDVERALQTYRGYADAGDAQAALAAGRYFEGQEPTDYTEVVAWYRQAAELGSSEAQVRLARLEWTGTGLPQNVDGAVSKLTALADAGEAAALLELGKIWEESGTSPEDRDTALRYYARSAELGRDDARLRHAFLTLAFPSDEHSLQKATSVLRDAANSGLATASFALGEWNLINALGDPALVAIGESWLEKSAAQGDPRAPMALFVHYGAHPERDATGVRGWRWLQEAAARGEVGAHAAIAQHRLAEGDPVAALAYFLAAVELGDEGAVARAVALMKRLPPPEIDAAERRAIEIVASRSAEDTAVSAPAP